MPGRLPQRSDFPSALQLDIVPPPSSHSSGSSPPPSNVLILLHGLGDTSSPFTTLARNLNLPETVCLSIQAPTPLPFELGGFHWGDDIQFDQASGHMEFDTGFERACRVVGRDGVEGALVEKCGFARREVVLWGFGQGGMAALVAAALSASTNQEELGGVVSIGGPLPSTSPVTAQKDSGKAKTPVLLLGGSAKTLITSSAVSRLKERFEFVEYKQWKKVGDGMPGNREEMLPIMQFLARRLRSQRGVPEGSVEVT